MKRITETIIVNCKYGLEVYVELSEDESLNKEFAKAIFAIIGEFFKICSAPFPAGIRPIRIFYRSEGPITDSTSDINLYQIGLNPWPRCYDQLTYQLGHELGHVLSDPRRSNWFVESCCEMMSQLLLFRMSEAWINEIPFQGWTKNDGPKFLEYAKHMVKKWRTDEFGADRSPKREELIDIKNLLKSDPCNRSKNGIIAEMLLPFFEKSLNDLSVLAFLGKASDIPPLCLKDWDSTCKIDFKFEKWEETVPEDFKKLVNEIKKMFE